MRHFFDGGLDGNEDDSLASPRDVGEKSVLDRIVLGTVGRVVGHADFQTDPIRKFFQAVFENIPVGRIAAAAIAKQ